MGSFQERTDKAMTNTSAVTRLGHTAIAARRPERVAEFYRDLLGLQIVRQTNNGLVGDAVLLTGDPAAEDHELVFVTNRSAEHIAFRVETLQQLRACYERAQTLQLHIPYALDSGIALSFFVRDPEGNAVEIYLARSEPRHDKPPLQDPAEIDVLILGG
jgi:catechol-2,3-dioxygenase